MTRASRVRLGLAGLALLVVLSILGSAAALSGEADGRADELASIDALSVAVSRGDSALVGAGHIGRGAAVDAVLASRDTAAKAFGAAREHLEDEPVRVRLVSVRRAYQEWVEGARDLVLQDPEERSMRALVAHQQATEALLTGIADLRAAFEEEEAHHLAGLTRRLVLLAVGVILLVGLPVTTAFSRRERDLTRRRARMERLRRGQEEFNDAMQLVADEDEAHELLKRHLQRELDRADVTVLNRNNSDNRLEATTSAPADIEGALRGGIEPRACLAVRSGRPHGRQAGVEALVTCELCGARPRDTTCQPLLVSGEVIGAVLVGHPEPLDDLEQRGIADAVSQSAPVLGNLRTLALAETRAATDALTGLPNRRALQDTLKRMVAQAQRSDDSLAALAVDLDHFKQVNDVFGHEKGDEVLAAVGRVLADSVRDADFAARSGGEEFVVLLPDTDAAGAGHVAEKLREAISRIEVPGVDRRVTASFGVAAFPFHAFDSPTLLRKADRALYAAKERGRDRVELAAAPVAGDARG